MKLCFWSKVASKLIRYMKGEVRHHNSFVRRCIARNCSCVFTLAMVRCESGLRETEFSLEGRVLGFLELLFLK